LCGAGASPAAFLFPSCNFVSFVVNAFAVRLV
jgi:hypothetical protein